MCVRYPECSSSFGINGDGGDGGGAGDDGVCLEGKRQTTAGTELAYYT